MLTGKLFYYNSFLSVRLSTRFLTTVTCYNVRSSRPGRPPKRASGVGLSLAATQFPGHPFKKHRLENGEYSPYENGHMSGKFSIHTLSIKSIAFNCWLLDIEKAWERLGFKVPYHIVKGFISRLSSLCSTVFHYSLLRMTPMGWIGVLTLMFLINNYTNNSSSHG